MKVVNQSGTGIYDLTGNSIGVEYESIYVQRDIGRTRLANYLTCGRADAVFASLIEAVKQGLDYFELPEE